MVERLSFDAWGRRRLASWQDAPELPESSLSRGFTGHEQLDEVGLIHMNGRVYDPDIGRFLSADPFIQAPEDIQNLNRYSYVLNNPMSYTDPSGFFFKKVFKAVAKAVLFGVAAVTKHAKTIITLGATLVATAVATAACGPVCGGAVGGFVSNFTGTILHGGSLSDALSSGFRGAISGAFSAAAFGSLHNLDFSPLKIAAHGVVGGVSSVLEGGKFEHGFISAAFTQAFAPAISQFSSKTARIIAAAVVGGTAAELSGGKFANGAITGAFSRMFNDELESMAREHIRKEIYKYKKMVDGWGRSIADTINYLIPTKNQVSEFFSGVSEKSSLLSAAMFTVGRVPTPYTIAIGNSAGLGFAVISLASQTIRIAINPTPYTTAAELYVDVITSYYHPLVGYPIGSIIKEQIKNSNLDRR